MTSSGASTPSDPQPQGTIVLLGRPCDNTVAVARVLQDEGIALTAVILADPAAPREASPPEPGIPPWYRSPSPRATRRLLEQLEPDLVIAACYPWRLSARARAIPRFGILNMHPSPLPHGRGPDPTFWVFRNGERNAGVTIHLMDDGLDTGPILIQQVLAVPEEMDAAKLELHLFESGARLAAGILPQVLTGAATYVPQDHDAATYQPAPVAQDWLISPLLPAAWAWRFARGVESLHGPLTVQSRGTLVPVRRAIAWGEQCSPLPEPPPGTLLVQFRPGWVLFEQ